MIVFMLSLLSGCAQSSAVYDGITISERPISEVNWQNVEDDYSPFFFRERTIHLPDWQAKVVGMEPRLYTHHIDTLHDVSIWVFFNDFQNYSYLYLIKYGKQRYIIEVISHISSMSTADLPTCDDIIGALYDGTWCKPLEPQNADKTFVHHGFFDFVTEKNIKLPNSFIKLDTRETYMDSTAFPLPHGIKITNSTYWNAPSATYEKLAPSHSAGSFELTTIEFDHQKIRLLGFRLELSRAVFDWTYPVKMLELNIGSTKRNALFIIQKEGRCYLAQVCYSNRVVEPSLLVPILPSTDDLMEALDNKRDDIRVLQVQEDKIYVWESFYDDLKEYDGVSAEMIPVPQGIYERDR